jgi:tetratricopeptide (TPR) repeat protein
LKENTAHIQATSERVADVTTPNLEAYQQFFLGEQSIDHLEFKKAQAAYNSAIELDSTFALAHYRLAYANWWGGESEEIQRAQLQKALNLIDRLPEKYRYLLRAQHAVNEEGYDAGIEILKEMEEIYPDDPEMTYNIGDFSFHAGHHEQAEEYLQKVLALDANSQRALNHLIMTYTAMGDQARAIETGKRYAGVAKSDYAYLTLSNTYLSQGDTDGALRVAEEARAEMPENPWIQRQIATVRCMNDEFMVAKSILDSLVTQSDDIEVQRMTYSSLLGANLYMGRYNEALGNADQYLTLAWAEGDSVAAVFQHQTKGIIYLWGWNNREKAAAEFDEARTLQEMINPDRFGKSLPEYWANLMAYYLLIGETEQAKAIAENRLSEKSEQYNRFRFFRLWAEGDYQGAQAVADELLANKENRDKAVVLYYLAKSQMEHGDYDQALESLQELQARRHYTGSRPMFYTPSFYLLGQTYEQKGDIQSAIASYRKFLEFWHQADSDLPLLQEAKLRLAELESSSTQ